MQVELLLSFKGLSWPTNVWKGYEWTPVGVLNFLTWSTTEEGVCMSACLCVFLSLCFCELAKHHNTHHTHTHRRLSSLGSVALPGLCQLEQGPALCVGSVCVRHTHTHRRMHWYALSNWSRELHTQVSISMLVRVKGSLSDFLLQGNGSAKQITGPSVTYTTSKSESFSIHQKRC